MSEVASTGGEVVAEGAPRRTRAWPRLRPRGRGVVKVASTKDEGATPVASAADEATDEIGEAETRTPHFAHATAHATDGVHKFTDGVRKFSV